jgi:hypothetical protein
VRAQKLQAQIGRRLAGAKSSLFEPSREQNTDFVVRGAGVARTAAIKARLSLLQGSNNKHSLIVVTATSAAAVTQWLEPIAHNGLVAGSSPAGPTNTLFDVRTL